jgi:hypothetical protein
MTARDDEAHLPVVRAADLAEAAPDAHWLIESLWARAGVGILGGAPKCCKSWLALDIALSVATATPCLDRFPVCDPGGALVYMAEDGTDIVKHRLACLSRHRGLALSTALLDVITVPSIRLDTERDRGRLARTVERSSSRLLVLDPFVRLHRSIHENDAGEVAALLAYLRDLQREHDIAILVVHHARKNGSTGGSAGHGLRGSGDFFAWADSLLYLQRRRDGLALATEHRAAPAPDTCTIVLDATQPDCTHLRLHAAASTDVAPTQTNTPSVDLPSAILAALRGATSPLTRPDLRAALRVRNERLGTALAELLDAGLVTRDGDRWAPIPVPVPRPS